MKTRQIMKGILAGAMLAACSMTSLTAAGKGDLIVNIEGVRNNNGMVMIALTESPTPTDMKFVQANMAKADSTGMQFAFRDLPDGTYYLQVFHDENSNFKMDLSDGKPTEGIGRTAGELQQSPAAQIEGGKKEVKVGMYYF